MKTNFYTAILLSFIMALASCSKYVVEPDTNFTDRSITIKEAQDYYKPKSTNAGSARQLAAEGNIQKLENSPNWKRAIEKTLGEQQAVIVPLQYKDYTALRSYDNNLADNKTLPLTDSKLSMNELSFMYFHKDDSGSIVQETVLQVPDENWAKNPTRKFSGRIIILDEQSNFKKGIILEDGGLKGHFRLGESSKNGRPNLEICGYIEIYGMNFQSDGHGNPIQTPTITTLGSIPIYCTLAPDISTGTQVPAPYYGPGGFYNTPPTLTEAQYFESVFVVGPGPNGLKNVPNYLKCFSNQSNNIYKITISVDQPIAGSTAPFNPLAAGKHFVGHTYVTLTQIESNGNMIQRTIGFYPAYGGSPANPNVPAEFHDDSQYTGGWDVQLTFPVTGSEMMNVVNYIPSYANANYDLGSRNCGNFAIDVLGRVGVSVTPHWMWQYWYSANTDYYGQGSSVTIQGPSIGSLGEQLYNTPPQRAMSKSHAGGEAPKNYGTCN